MSSRRRYGAGLLASLLSLALLGVALQAGAQTPPPSFSINDRTANEGSSGTTSFVFRVTLSNYPAAGNPTFRVDFATANGAAMAGACASGFDYVSTSGQLNFNRNNLFRDITVSVCGDTTFEPDETFFVDLSNPSGGAVIGKGRGIGTIVNDDAAPVRPTATNVSCTPATVPVAGTTTCTATVTDTSSGTNTPKGTVTFSLVTDEGEAGAFTPAATCTLDPTATGDSNSCSVGYTPATIGDGTHGIGASYTPTDGIHAASSDPTPFQLTVRARTTSTTVDCTPNPVPVLGTTSCTATVTDDDAGTSTPKGTVTFSLVTDEGEAGAFTPAATCTLDPTATGDSNSCSVGYTPATIGDGTHGIGASYTPTDGIHAASSDPTPFQLTVRARTTSTTVDCTPSTFQAGDSTTCKATVTDTDAPTKRTPTGTVTWTSSESTGAFVPNPCVLQSTTPLDPAAPASCRVTYSSTKASQQTITASYGGDPIHETSSGSTTVTVKPGPPAIVTVDPPAATNPVDTEHCVTATVTDRFDNPTPDITVVFSVTGSNTASGSRTTGAGGETPPFCYTGVLIGITDMITAFADFNPENGNQDVGEPSGAATKIWEIPASTALCEVVITEGGLIVAQNGDRASFGGNAQVSSAGEPTGQQEYQDHGPAQPMNVKSTRILAVLCSANQATIFGLATIDGSGEFAYRIDVQDLGEPGVGQDTYRMRIGIYDSGQPGTLLGGNVQIHKG